MEHLNISNSVVSLFLDFSRFYCSPFVIKLVFCSICALAC